MFDLVLKDGMIYTGAGNPWFKGDIAVKDGRIFEVGQISGEATEILDVSGKAVSPGFIDLHDHSDFPLLVERKAENKIKQGVSTLVFPSCGSGAAPLNDYMREDILRRSPYLKEGGVEVDWSTVDEYLKRLEKGISVNVAPLVGFGTIRRYVMGMEMRGPTSGELEAMKMEVATAMEAGCLGLTTGLRYDPQSYAETEEVIELAKVAAKYGGFYTSHIRDEGDRGDPVGAIEEIIRIGREAGIPVNISHFKILAKRFWHEGPRLVDMIEEAREEGIDVTADQYPYRASGTGPGAWIPKWANEGGLEALAKRLVDPEVAPEIQEGLVASMEDRSGPEAALISTYSLDPSLVGKTIADVAEMRGENPEDTIFELFKAHTLKLAAGELKGGFGFVNFNQSLENVDLFMRMPWVAVGSDGSVHAPDSVLARHSPAPHPRHYGTFPRVLGHFARDRGVIGLHEAVRKMTSLPARILSISDRGLIMPGMWADLAVFDPETVLDGNDFVPAEATMRYPIGIDHVVVNGVLTLKDGEHTGVLAGLVLRRK
jgi:N-acyl-D-amino-acid deacylase